MSKRASGPSSSGQVDATLLSCAGLKRLGIEAGTAIPTEVILPAPGQAVIGMECKTNDTRTQSVLTTVNNQITYDCIMAERAFTRALGATCASPVAAFCVLEDGDLRMRAQLFSEDGRDMVEQRAVFDCGDSKTPTEPARSLFETGARNDPETLLTRMRRLIVLRPEPGASATVERARALGLDAVAIPLFRIEPIAWTAPDAGQFEGLLLTSANAVRHGGDQLEHLRGLPVYAVGEATAEVARAAGFDIASQGEAGVDRLLGSIEPDLKLLHLAGESRREPAGPRQAHHDHSRLSCGCSGDPRSWPQRRALSCSSIRRAQDAVWLNWSLIAPSLQLRRSVQRRPMPPAKAGTRWKRPHSPMTMRCWPSRHGCATNRRCNERHSHGMGLGRAINDRAGPDRCRRRGCDLGPCALPLCCAVARGASRRPASHAYSEACRDEP